MKFFLIESILCKQNTLISTIFNISVEYIVVTLLDSIVKETIKNHGPLSFADFMHMALYYPTYGYYNSILKKIGPAGDFVTAPELTYLFGYTLANQCKDIFNEIPNPTIFEFGAGTGKLCIDILTYLEKTDSLPKEYLILEVSNYLKDTQEELINQKIPHLANKVKWLTTWPTEKFSGIVIANEVLDAMPVNLFTQNKNNLTEIYIDLDKDNNLIKKPFACNNNELEEYVKIYMPKTTFPYTSEANLFINDWIMQCHNMLNKGSVFIIDYGFPKHEYYHPDRSQGTLMCHYQHKSNQNPLINIGEQDITAHVNFSHIANAAFDAGFHIAGYTNQASFLLNNDILNIIMDDNSINTRQALKTLLQPSEMGELFKVIALTKGLEIDLKGFKINDKRVSL
jgi:SAM-dependent MidA family methyltransferase